jgi:two-component system, NtrC family, sensor kinase
VGSFFRSTVLQGGEAEMVSSMPIRKKILMSMALLSGILLLLMSVSLQGVYAYKDLTKSVGELSYEVNEMWSLGQEISELRSTFHSFVPRDNTSRALDNFKLLLPTNEERVRALEQNIDFSYHLNLVRIKLDSRRERLQSQAEMDPLLATSSAELSLVNDMRNKVRLIEQMDYEFQGDSSAKAKKVGSQLDDIAEDARSLVTLLTERMRKLRTHVKSTYNAWIIIIVASGIVLLGLLTFAVWFLRKQVVQPFKELLNGSRRIAAGDFDHRIILASRDELSELAEAQNKMTSLFVEIKNNLDRKVRERTQEVVRSEQLASVGFLAAGVAHEINNPLASIAWSAEALESRLHDILHRESAEKSADGSEEASESNTEASGDHWDSEELKILSRYLKKIQDEAFRCKGITERLLDFSRLGESQPRQTANIYDCVNDMVELVRHLGQYRNRTLRFEGDTSAEAWVSPTEIKQVVLNLLTNSLDASEDGQEVRVHLSCDTTNFRVIIEDDGCGMTNEVMTHLFEPFFTRRRDGRGTGLGLSITYRIVQDHAGTLVPESNGPGKGSRFTLTIPLNPVQNQSYEKRQTA